ncbi:MAG: type I restriction-modification system subunit M N-terminal domain-containing protein [Candidatus Nitrosocosmicus sp.]
MVAKDYNPKSKLSKSIKSIDLEYSAQRVTFELLRSHIHDAIDTLKESLEPHEYRQPIVTLLFLKRLNDIFEEEAEKLVKQGKSDQEAYENKKSMTRF